jgi:hypothetical protein
MHCIACDRLLSEFEATRKNALTMDYIDLCKVCFEDVKGLFPVIERKDLVTESDLDPSVSDCEQDISGSVDVESTSREMDTGDCRDYIDYIVSNDSYEDS